MHSFLNLSALVSDLIIAKANFLLEPLYLIAIVSHDIGFLMPRRTLNCFNDLANLLMLLLQILKTILLPSILSDEVFHLRCPLYIIQLFLQSLRILINKAQKLLSDAHNHVTDIVFPPCKFMLSVLILSNRLFRELTHLIKLVKRGYITFVDILNVVFIYEAGEAFIALLLGGVEVKPTAMNRAAFT